MAEKDTFLECLNDAKRENKAMAVEKIDEFMEYKKKAFIWYKICLYFCISVFIMKFTNAQWIPRLVALMHWIYKLICSQSIGGHLHIWGELQLLLGLRPSWLSRGRGCIYDMGTFMFEELGQKYTLNNKADCNEKKIIII